MASPTIVGTPTTHQVNSSQSGFTYSGHTHNDEGQNNALMMAYISNQADQVSAVTWNSNAMTKLVAFTGVSSGNSSLWYQADPDEGNNSMVVTEDTATAWRNIVVFTLQDIVQSSALDTSGQSNTGSATSLAKSITTGVDNTLIITWASIGTSASSINADGSQTEIVAEFQGSGNPWLASSTLPKDTAGAQSTGFSWTTAQPADVFAASVKYLAPAFTPKVMMY